MYGPVGGFGASTISVVALTAGAGADGTIANRQRITQRGWRSGDRSRFNFCLSRRYCICNSRYCKDPDFKS
jgi:hypothetical protein